MDSLDCQYIYISDDIDRSTFPSSLATPPLTPDPQPTAPHSASLTDAECQYNLDGSRAVTLRLFRRRGRSFDELQSVTCRIGTYGTNSFLSSAWSRPTGPGNPYG